MTKTSIEKAANKQISSYQQYLGYAMDSFIKSLETIKISIKQSVIEDLKKKNTNVIDAEMQKQISKMVDDKLSVLIQIKFEE